MAISNKKAKNSVFHALTFNFQRGLITGTLEENKGNVSKAARLLGITRATLYSIVKVKTPPNIAFSDFMPLKRRQIEE